MAAEAGHDTPNFKYTGLVKKKTNKKKNLSQFHLKSSYATDLVETSALNHIGATVHVVTRGHFSSCGATREFANSDCLRWPVIKVSCSFKLGL